MGNSFSFQRKQVLGSGLATSGAFGVIPTHRQAAPGATPSLFFVLNPIPNADPADLAKVWQVFLTVQIAAHIHQVRNAIAGQLSTVSTTRILLFAQRVQPDVAPLAMGGKRAAAETAIAKKAIHPIRRRNPFLRLRRFG